ncbi:MAG: hypothetical protein GY757_49380, partial [bacterium]|nr:hypothetical protein [bacterium]
MKNSDLVKIKRLEKQIGRKLMELRRDSVQGRDSRIPVKRNTGIGYILDERSRVTDLYLEKLLLEELPESLTDFSHLKRLGLYGAIITNYSSLRPLTTLEALDLSYNDNLTHLSQLPKLPNLIYLDLKNNKLEDISPLKDLENLSVLDLSENQVSDASPLKELPRLTCVDLFDNNVSDLSFIETPCIWEHMTYLDLRKNTIKRLPEAILSLTLKIDMDAKKEDQIPPAKQEQGIF